LLIEAGEIPGSEGARHCQDLEGYGHLADLAVYREGQGSGGIPHATFGGVARFIGEEQDQGDCEESQGQQRGEDQQDESGPETPLLEPEAIKVGAEATAGPSGHTMFSSMRR
jgi:hypothetical protein